MDVKPSYKQTEVGVIPEDWKAQPLASVAFVTSGKRLPRGHFLTEHETPHPYIRVTDMRPGTVSLNDIKFVPIDVFPKIKRYRIFKEDIFISVAGTLGIIGKIPPELNGANLTENADRVTNITCSQNYLLHVLMSPLIQNTIDLLQTVGAQPKLALTRIRKFDIPLPPTKAEQEAIAKALSDADALIESLDQLITKKRHFKEGVMQQLLTGQTRLPGFSGKWEEIALGQMGKCYRGVSYNPITDLSPSDNSSSVRLLRSNNVQESSLIYADMQFVNVCRVSAGQLLRVKDILVCMSSGSRDLVGKAGQFMEDDGFYYTFGAFMGCFRANGQSSDPGYIFYLFQTEKYREQIAVLFAGSSINNLTPSNVETLRFHIPSEKVEQTAIASILSDMDAEIAVLEAKLAKTRQIKQGMMQELLTGRIRLK